MVCVGCGCGVSIDGLSVLFTFTTPGRSWLKSNLTHLHWGWGRGRGPVRCWQLLYFTIKREKCYLVSKTYLSGCVKELSWSHLRKIFLITRVQTVRGSRSKRRNESAEFYFHIQILTSELLKLFNYLNFFNILTFLTI